MDGAVHHRQQQDEVKSRLLRAKQYASLVRYIIAVFLSSSSSYHGPHHDVVGGAGRCTGPLDERTRRDRWRPRCDCALRRDGISAVGMTPLSLPPPRAGWHQGGRKA